jgi:uracil-DNA glycosylase
MAYQAMDAVDQDLTSELVDLTRRLRARLLRHASLGAWAAPGGPTARNAVEPEDLAVEAEAAGVEDAHEADVALRAPAPVAGIGAGIDGIPQAAEDEPAALGHRTLVPALASGVAIGAGDHGPGAASGAIRTLPQIRAELGECTRCKLHATRRSIVFGVGSADTPLMFVGEAPGEQEDRRGEPFVGPAGQLLDKMIEAMGWTRAQVYIANTTKCRPPNNRNPQPDELDQCMPFLHAQIAAIAPRIIVALGRPAANQLLGTDAPISSLRGRFHDYPRGGLGHHLKIMPTFHPAYLLRDPDKKRAAWSDLKLVMAELTRLGIPAPAPS